MAHYDVSTSQKKTNPELVAGGTLYSDAPVGCVLAFCGVIAPSGWFICDGSELNRDDFPELFNVIGTAFGTPSANTKFKLPDLRESTIKGAGLTGLANNHMDSDGLAVGEFLNDRIQNHSHNTYLTGVQISSGGAWATAHDYSTPGTHTSNPETPARIGDTTEVKAVGANWIIKAQQTALPLDIENQVETAADAYIEQKLKGVLEYTLTVSGQWENYTTNHMVIRFVDEASNVDLRISFADIVQGSSQTYNTIGQTSEGRQINIFRGAIGSNIVYVSIAGSSTDHIKCYGCDF